MDRLIILAPALVLSVATIASFLMYTTLCVIGRSPKVSGLNRRKFTSVLGPFIVRYMLWVLRPLERAVVALGIHPNAITFSSLIACASAGLGVASGHLATAGWLYILAGLLDILDGRLARATNRSSQAGAFLDSVADRWGELFIFAGFAWFLRDTIWLGAVMLAVSGSIMVSYTRARGEGLSLVLDGGNMQRAERIALVSVGTLLTAWFDAASSTAVYGPHIIGVALLMVGVASTVTAVGRWSRGYRMLKVREGVPPAAVPDHVPSHAAAKQLGSKAA